MIFFWTFLHDRSGDKPVKKINFPDKMSTSYD